MSTLKHGCVVVLCGVFVLRCLNRFVHHCQCTRSLPCEILIVYLNCDDGPVAVVEGEKAKYSHASTQTDAAAAVVEDVLTSDDESDSENDWQQLPGHGDAATQEDAYADEGPLLCV
jgi:hypothetical protein